MQSVIERNLDSRNFVLIIVYIYRINGILLSLPAHDQAVIHGIQAPNPP